jgi:hypothetical protein
LKNGNEEEAISEQMTASRKRPPEKAATTKDLDEEVEGEQEQTEDEEEGAEGEAALGEAADGVEEANGNYAEARFGARKIEGPRGFVAGEIAAEGGEFVFHPNGEFVAVAPKIQGAEQENPIAETSQQTQSRTRTPIKHGTSPPDGRLNYSKPLREW